MPINFYGGARSIKTVSYYQALDPEHFLPKGIFEDKLVFVGDLLSTTGEPHVQRYYATNWSQITESLECLKVFRPEMVYTGHGTKPLPGERLQELVPPKY